MRKFFFLLVLLSVGLMACQNASQAPQTKAAAEKVEATVNPTAQAAVQVYYFHGDRRCVTCKAVGKVALETVLANDQEQVVFLDVNIDQAENATLAEQYEVASSSLIVTNGSQVKDLTADAFALARNEPAELKALLQEVIDAQL